MEDNNYNNIKDEIKIIIGKVIRNDPKKINDNQSLRNDLWIDSLQAIQIVALLEEKYSINIDEVEIFNVDTVCEVADLVLEYSNY